MSDAPDDRATRNVQAGAGQPDCLEVLCGPEDGKRVAVRGDAVTIGRTSDNDLCIPLDLSVSRHHARLVRRGHGFVLDVLSTARNPAGVRGLTVPPGQSATLERGDTFTLGDILFELGVDSACGAETNTTVS